MNKMMQKRTRMPLVTALTVLGGAILLSGCTGKTPDTTAPTNYATITLSPQPRTLYTEYSASLLGRQDVEIYPQVTGTIREIRVEEGTVVRRGQTLFIIDQVPYQSALNTAAANVEAARAGVATAQLTYDSRVELHRQDVVSEFDMLTAANELALANAELAQMEAERDNAANNLTYTLIISPSDGVVGNLPYRVGALVSPSVDQPLTTVSDNSQMNAYFSMNETQLLQMTRRYGSMRAALDSIPDVELRLSDGSLYEQPGRIESISGVIDRTTGTVSFKAAFPNEGRLLHSGATGRVRIPTIRQSALVIPQAATYELQERRYVYTVVDGAAKSAQITVLPTADGREYIVESGLTAGDVIVAEGVGTLREGMAINSSNN